MNKNLFKGILALVIGLLGALLYRWRGLSSKYKKYFPRPFNQALLALPFAVFTYFNVESYHLTQASVVWLSTTLFILTGHGGWMDLAHSKKERKDERFEFFVKWLKPVLPEYWYDVLGLSVNGMFITVTAGICTLNPLVALLGILKAPAYMLGWAIYPKGKGTGIPHLNEATGIGEALTGLFLYSGLAIIWLYSFT
jgi:hypothetical protein